MFSRLAGSAMDTWFSDQRPVMMMKWPPDVKCPESAGKFGKNTFYGIVRKRRGIKTECRRAFRYKIMFCAVACGPVIVFGRPGSHIGGRVGVRREA